MLLKTLKLNNIRSYHEAVIDFPEGSSLLLGDIGSGKTTILLAVEFALFGLIKGDVSGSTLLRHGAKEGYVELSFMLDNNNITIRRTLKRKKDTIVQDSGHIIINNRLTELTPIELKSKILELFGYPQELLNKNTSLIYRYTVYTPQEEMKTILFETIEQRLDTLRKIFNIDRYKRVRENALEYSRELKTQKKILEAKTSDIEEKRQSLKSKTEQKDDLKKLYEELAKELTNAQSIHKTAADELKSYESKILELTNLKKEYAVIDANLKNSKNICEKNTKDLSMIDFRIKEYASKLQELGNIEQTEEVVRQELTDAEQKLTKINAAKEIIKQRIENKSSDLKRIIIEDMHSLMAKNSKIQKDLEKKPQLEEELESLEKTHADIMLQINSLNISKTQSQKIINQLKDLSTCPTCLQTVDFTHKINITDKETLNEASAERKIGELTKKHSETEKKTQSLKTELEIIRRAEIELREITLRLKDVQTKTEEKQLIQKEFEELQIKQQKLDAMDINKLVDIVSKNRKILNSLEVRKHIDESLKEKQSQQKELLETLKKSVEEKDLNTQKLSEIQTYIASYKDLEKDYTQKRYMLEELAKKLKDIEIKSSTIKKELEIKEKDISQIREEILLKEKVIEKIHHIEELSHWINEHFISLTSLIERYIMAKIHQEFNELFCKWFEILMDDETLDVRIDEEFTPKIRQNEYDTEIENLSGGEKTAIALAYRLALNKVINDFISSIKTKDIIILDEPTDGFSEEQLDKMREVFEELKMPQMILVSHEAKMETYVEHIVRIMKHNHMSKVM